MYEAATVEVAAAASIATTYVMFRIPTRARISGLSRISWDDLASTGSPTLSVGLKAVDANFTTSATALNSGLDVFTAAGTASMIGDVANYGKQIWELAGATTDPGGMADITVAIAAAATNTGGTVTCELFAVTDA
jgi:hypothetical protein